MRSNFPSRRIVQARYHGGAVEGPHCDVAAFPRSAGKPEFVGSHDLPCRMKMKKEKKSAYDYCALQIGVKYWWGDGGFSPADESDAISAAGYRIDQLRSCLQSCISVLLLFGSFKPLPKLFFAVRSQLRTHGLTFEFFSCEADATNRLTTYPRQLEMPM